MEEEKGSRDAATCLAPVSENMPLPPQFSLDRLISRAAAEASYRAGILQLG